MIVDCHTHVWETEHLSREWNEAYERAHLRPADEIVVNLKTHYRTLTSQVDKVVVLGFRTKWLGVLVPNEYVAQYVATDPKRLIGFMSIDPSYDDVETEIDGCYHNLGLRGIKISPIYQNFHPTDRKAYPIYEKAKELHLPLLIHAASTWPRTAPLKYANPILFEDVMIEFPQVKMIFAHLGHPWGHEMATLTRKHPNVYADCSGVTSKPWKFFNILLDWYDYCRSFDKIVFGSDYPWATPTQTMNALRRLNRFSDGIHTPTLPKDQIENIITKNWEKVFPALRLT